VTINMADQEAASESQKPEENTEDVASKKEEDNGIECCGEPFKFKMVWNKVNYDMVKLGKGNNVGHLRKYIEELTGIPPNMQKIMYKGLVKDDTKTLEEIKLTSGAKVMVVGSTIKDIEKVKTPTTQELRAEAKAEAAASKEPLCKQKQHQKVIEKGKPDDVPIGVKGKKEPLPHVPLSGMVNKTGGRVRLTFKLELDQLWLGTKERTEKLPMSSIRNVLSEAIEGQEEYHILAIQLGPTEASRYWIYWFPAQYVDAVKDTILGKWQAF